MKKGKLSFTGTIDLNQFWPQSVITKNRFDSDADTVKVKVDMKSIRFVSAAGKPKDTKVLNNAGFWHKVKSKKGKPKRKFTPVIKNGIVTMRLQGIDAPELHYGTGRKSYRQHMGETSTVNLYQFLKDASDSTPLKCEVFTLVNKPNDVFDKYGRCVGDIVITGKDGVKHNVNHWLVKMGYAFPAFYDSMTDDEINSIVNLSNEASSQQLNIWKFHSQQMDALDRTLLHDKKSATYDEAEDRKSPVIFPKLFRRLYSFEITGDQSFDSTKFQAFLKKSKDVIYGTGDFLADQQKTKASKKTYRSTLDRKVDVSGGILFKPEEVVFAEAETTLKNDKGKTITSF